MSDNETLELNAILETMADGLFVIDTVHRIQRWNRAMERLTGYAASEAIGQPCTMLRGEESTCEGGLGIVDSGLSEAGRIEGEEVLIRRKDGTRIPLMVGARVMTESANHDLGAVVTMTDISKMRRLEDENRRLREAVGERAAFHNIVGVSTAMHEVFRLIELAADSDATVLVVGETGTGKELVARAIHHHSARRDQPLITVNCTALSESLLESELFGHVKGAFTGALRDRAGRFESAAGGTVFLDEVGELPPLVQVKLLRVLQERTIERVGEGVPRHVDVRVIAATHRDLRARTAEAAFREDLFYRLNVFPIRVPPLRERREDIAPLVEHFVRDQAQRTGKEIHGVVDDAMRMILDHAWPGNVRELENAVAHAFITCPGGRIGPFDLPLELRQAGLASRATPGSAGSLPSLSAAMPGQDAQATPDTARRRSHSITREALQATLAECNWNKAEAARRLGLDRTTVWRKMKAWGIALQPDA